MKQSEIKNEKKIRESEYKIREKCVLCLSIFIKLGFGFYTL